MEKIEIDRGLTDHSKKVGDEYPVYLKPDVNNDYRYFAYHNAGLHAISIEFIPELQRFFVENGLSFGLFSTFCFTKNV